MTVVLSYILILSKIRSKVAVEYTPKLFLNALVIGGILPKSFYSALVLRALLPNLFHSVLVLVGSYII